MTLTTLFQAHRLILAIASPFFEAQFFGLLAGDHNDTDEVKDVDSDAFRRLLDFIYNSGPVDWDMDSIEYWNLLHAAHMYLVPGLYQTHVTIDEDSNSCYLKRQ